MAKLKMRSLPFRGYPQTHCQLSLTGLAAVFCAGIAFKDALTAVAVQNTVSLGISIAVLLVDLLCFSIDIQRLRTGGYTRNALGLWRPDKSVTKDSWGN